MAKKDTRRHIIKVAAKLFAHKGYVATSTLEICKEANVNLSLIAYYFGGKEGLFKAIVEECFQPIFAFIEANKNTQSPIECLQNYFICIKHYAQDEYFGLFLAKLISSPFFEFVAQNYSLKVFNFVKGIIEKGITQGIFRENLHIKYTCISLLSMLNFYIVNQKALDQAIEIFDDEDYFAHTFELFLCGIKKS